MVLHPELEHEELRLQPTAFLSTLEREAGFYIPRRICTCRFPPCSLCKKGRNESSLVAEEL